MERSSPAKLAERASITWSKFRAGNPRVRQHAAGEADAVSMADRPDGGETSGSTKAIEEGAQPTSCRPSKKKRYQELEQKLAAVTPAEADAVAAVP